METIGISDERAFSTPFWAREWLMHFIEVAVGAAVVCGASLLASAVIHDLGRPDPQTIAPYTFHPSQVSPEPAERAAYGISLLAVPLVLLASLPKVKAIVGAIPEQRVWRAYFISLCVGACTILIAAAGDRMFYLRGCLAGTHPLLFVTVTVALGEAWLLVTRRTVTLTRLLATARDGVLIAAVLLFLAALECARIFSYRDPYVTDGHCDIILFAVSQVQQGRTLLIDAAHQYGLYPEFLAPLLSGCGGTDVMTFTWIMSAVNLFVHALWLTTLIRVFHAKWLALLTFVGAMAFFYLFTPSLLYEHHGHYYDTYFQYTPIRTLFPAIALAACSLITRHERIACRRWRVLGSTVLASGMLWNLDAGVPAWGAWVACLSYASLMHAGDGKLRTGMQAAAVTVAEAVVWSCLVIICAMAWLAWKSSALPDMSLLVRFQSHFYGLGFFMLPMKVMHSWLLWVAVMIAGMSFALVPLALWQPQLVRQEPLHATVFGWVTLASGLFSYYQGRSHDWVFPLITPIAFVLVGLVIDRMMLPTICAAGPSIGWRRSAAYVTTAFVVLLSTGAASVGTAQNILPTALGWRVGTLLATAIEDDPVTQAIDFVRRRVAPGQSVMIVSNHAGVYHMETQTLSKMKFPLAELFMKSDRDQLLADIRKESVVYADASVLQVATPNTNLMTNLLISQALLEQFVVGEESPEGYMLELHRKPQSDAQ